ncbi:hypothetical protein ACFV7R_07630 [Streptomyces sp. NPDC059866]|uniref:hypothetical protein n=1 Tax=Streptomyces sp. NPDC059866 TaxID=3346978 RepID=UPI00365515A5
MSGTAQEVSAQALALLVLPSLDKLSEQQVRGSACVWDGVPFTTGIAVDLGPRRKKRLDGHYDWFPRGCPRCVGEKALLALFEHAPKYEPCRHHDDGNPCPTGRALLRLTLRRGR